MQGSQYLAWTPLISIGFALLTEQVLEDLPSAVSHLEPQVDAEGHPPAWACPEVRRWAQPHPTACPLHFHPFSLKSLAPQLVQRCSRT